MNQQRFWTNFLTDTEEKEKLRKFIIDQEYDTDSINIDISTGFDGNIDATKFGQDIPTKIHQFIQTVLAKCMSLFLIILV